MTQQPEVMIGHARGRFDQEGNLTDVVTKEFIIGLLQNLAEWTGRIAHELNRRDVITNLLVWLSGILERSS
jgi:hypothetical protein